jgi:hypothetical protein
VWRLVLEYPSFSTYSFSTFQVLKYRSFLASQVEVGTCLDSLYVCVWRLVLEYLSVGTKISKFSRFSGRGWGMFGFAVWGVATGPGHSRRCFTGVQAI